MDVLNDSRVSFISQSYIRSHLILLAVVILFYDHLLTFGDEYRRIWKNLRNYTSWIFLLNRYFAVASNIMTLIEFFLPVMSNWGCSKHMSIHEIMIVLMESLACMTQLPRLYILCGRSKSVGAVICMVGLAVLGLAIWSIDHVALFDTTEILGCHTILRPDAQSSFHLAAPWLAITIWDGIVFSLIFYKTSTNSKSPKLIGQPRDILSLILRDGALYFIVMATANLSNVLTFFASPPELKGCLSVLASNVSVNLTSRLMLNLHEFAVDEQVGSSDEPDGHTALPLYLTSQINISFGVLSPL